MNAKSLLLLPAAVALGIPSSAHAYVGFRFNLALPLYYPAPAYAYAQPVVYETPVVQAQPVSASSEPVSPAPGPGYVWLGGHWNRQGDQWAWTPGRWELPPSPSATWVAGHWTQSNSAWVWINGAWTIGSAAQAPQGAPPLPPTPGSSPQFAPASVPAPSTPPPAAEMTDGTEVNYEPPAAIAEYVPTCPYPDYADYLWVGGYWGWRSGWYWYPGRYIHRPYRGAAWIGGGWGHGSHGGWAWHGGHWR